jgi:hypothetical protein
MSRRLTFAALALSLTACATDDPAGALAKEEAPEIPLSTVELRAELDKEGNPIPGTLVLDTEDGRLDITPLVEDKPREFASREDFHRFMIEKLGAQKVERPDGLIGSSLEYTSPTTLLLDPETGEYELIDDAVEKIVGGRTGYVVIEGKEECVAKACLADLAQEKITEERRIVGALGFGMSTPTGRIGVQGISWHSPPKPFLPFYTTVGASTTQWGGTAGLRLRWFPCSTNVFRTCVALTGGNVLVVSYAARFGAATRRADAALTGNVFSLVRARGDWDVWPFTGTDNICTTHLAIDGEAPATVTTGAGFGLPFNDCP